MNTDTLLNSVNDKLHANGHDFVLNEDSTLEKKELTEEEKHEIRKKKFEEMKKKAYAGEFIYAKKQ